MSEYDDDSRSRRTGTQQSNSEITGTPWTPQGSSVWEAGEDDEDLGDLSDCPLEHRHEVVELIRSLPGPGDPPGNIDHLRTYIHTVKRLGGFSREASQQLFRAMTELLAAPRPKGPNMPTMVGLQQAFVRMDGVKETINAMLLRLSDAEVVATTCRLLAAAVQGSPLAVEFLLDGKPDDVRLLLRTIERHRGDLAVAEAGCVLIAHLCSQPSTKGPAAGARARGHCNAQSALQRDGGVLDLVVNILATSVKALKKEAEQVEKQHAKATEAANSKKLPKAGIPIAPSTGKIDVSEAWMKLHETDLTAGRVQAAALQALLLLCFGNADTTRQLASELWCWGKSYQAVEDAEKAKETSAAAAAAAAAHNVQRRQPPGRKQSKANDNAQQSANAGPSNSSDLPDGEERCALTTLKSFGRTSKLMVAVLNGRAARDRPALGVKACRVLGLLVEHAINLAKHIEHGKRKDFAELVVTLRPGPIPADDRKAQAPFAPLESLLHALTLAVRTHKDDPALLATSLSLLKKLKTFALSSTPPGVGQGSDDALYAWQRALGEAEEGDELAQACKVLQQALGNTEVANAKLAQSMCTAEQLSGDAVYLTPRMREFVAQTTLEGAEIAGDTLARKWRGGEPERKTRTELRKAPTSARGRNRQSPAHAHANQTEGKASKGLAVPKGLAAKAVHAVSGGSHLSTPKGGSQLTTPRQQASTLEGDKTPRTPGGRRASTEVPLQLKEALAGLDSPAKKEKSPGKRRRGAARGGKGTEKQPEEASDWVRAIGFEACDEADFKRMWEEPLRDALQRSVSMPSLHRQRLQKNVMLGIANAVDVPEAAKAEDEAAEEEAFEFKFVDSEPGILRTQLVLRSSDRRHQSVSDLRLKQLMDLNVSNAEVTPAITKLMKRSGHLLPDYGIQVVFKRGQRLSPLATAGSGVLSSLQANVTV